MFLNHENRRHTVKFWLLVLAYWLVTGAAVGFCFGLHGDLPRELQYELLLPAWAVVLSVMAIILTGLVADADDDFSLFWVDLALLVLFAIFNLLDHAYVTAYWGFAPALAGTAILTVWPWMFVFLFAVIALASLARRTKPGMPSTV